MRRHALTEVAQPLDAPHKVADVALVGHVQSARVARRVAGHHFDALAPPPSRRPPAGAATVAAAAAAATAGVVVVAVLFAGAAAATGSVVVVLLHDDVAKVAAAAVDLVAGRVVAVRRPARVVVVPVADLVLNAFHLEMNYLFIDTVPLL